MTRLPPPIRVVVKGWWLLNVQAAVLEHFDYLCNPRRRPWWRGLNRKWK